MGGNLVRGIILIILIRVEGMDKDIGMIRVNKN